MDLPFPIRQECPPGACDCERDQLLAAPQGDLRILRLTRDEEKRLIQRIEAAASLTDLRRLGGKMEELLGIVVRFAPGPNEVRTARGIVIDIQFRPGLCRKTRQSIPAAIRRCLDARPEIMFELLNEHDLLRDA
ncbi:hypothetical protein CEG14_21690 [Bordetella genomosp. 1]|uniref:Ribosomal protein S3AE n=1 Tax=Bordetella genomosp. 1 TaxID=1395607 RepID=A0A261RVX0_9BORD|nr:hypothetical protein [Bordetella genomosp. 1]MDQ8033301.1 hypothetical protein [Bordetella sp.]OZI29236.1 hypothetical protein CEG14_21690 [Bordetella genomosp. 1]OZI65031.1 hypothetical protein CAL27_08110 [Bordetella genomosp. 1]